MNNKLFFCFLLMIFSFHVQGQNTNIENFEVQVSDKTMKINWDAGFNSNTNYWQIEGSSNGKNFSAVGLVFGSIPGTNSKYCFKQNVSKLKKGLIYFRIVLVQNDNTAIAYKAIATK